MSDLQRAIAELAEQFATQVIRALRSAPLEEVAALATRAAGKAAAPAPAKPAPVKGAPAKPAKSAPASRRRGSSGGRRRRSAGDLAALGERIVELLKASGGGMRAEAIRDALGVPRKELPRVFNQLVDKGHVTKSGQKRATTYFVGDGNAPAKPAKPVKPAKPAKPAQPPRPAKPAKKAKK